jgi:hypothetical protein
MWQAGRPVSFSAEAADDLRQIGRRADARARRAHVGDRVHRPVRRVCGEACRNGHGWAR